MGQIVTSLNLETCMSIQHSKSHCARSSFVDILTKLHLLKARFMTFNG